MIIITRSDVDDDVSAALNSYMEYMRYMEFESNITTFRDRDAVLTTYTRDGMYCQEIFFPHNKAFYAVALRGGTEEEFYALLDTIEFSENADSESM